MKLAQTTEQEYLRIGKIMVIIINKDDIYICRIVLVVVIAFFTPRKVARWVTSREKIKSWVVRVDSMTCGCLGCTCAIHTHTHIGEKR
jgi:hypothetical protein